MPKSLKFYVDQVKALEYRNHQRKQNYKQTQKYSRRCWTEEEINMIITSTVTDRELSEILHRSVQSIQIKRSRLKKFL